LRPERSWPRRAGVLRWTGEHRVRRVGRNCRACQPWSRCCSGLSGGVPATVHCPKRRPAGRRLNASPRPRLPIAAAPDGSSWPDRKSATNTCHRQPCTPAPLTSTRYHSLPPKTPAAANPFGRPPLRVTLPARGGPSSPGAGQPRRVGGPKCAVPHETPVGEAAAPLPQRRSALSDMEQPAAWQGDPWQQEGRTEGGPPTHPVWPSGRPGQSTRSALVGVAKS